MANNGVETTISTMSSSGGIGTGLGGRTRVGKAMGPYLDKIVKNAAWRKHSYLVASCKSVLDHLDTLECDPDPKIPLPGDAELLLTPLIFALDSCYPKVAEPALECTFRLFSLGLLRGPVEVATSVLARLFESIFKVSGIGEEAVELAVLRVLLSAVRSPAVLIRGEYMVNVVRTCYNVYLGGFNGTNQICAKAVLAQMVTIVFRRAEENSLDASSAIVSVGDLLEFSDKNLNEGSSIQFSHSFLQEVFSASEAFPDLTLLSTPTETRDIVGEEHETDSPRSGFESKIRQDAFLLFRNLCKLSMKFSSQENPDDHILLRGKILSLELLKVVLENAGSIWRTDDRFLNAIKQYLCLSLIKNSALSVMAVFQLQCSLFMILLTKLRAVLKAEIGIFFPMLVLRVLENNNQPSFLQKMTILNLLDKIAQDPLTSIDIFVNYDCDVDAPNIFERTVNGLLKTALGSPAVSGTTLSSAQDLTFRYESVKCLVSIIKSMGTWMDQQLRLGDSYYPKSSDVSNAVDNHLISAEDGSGSDFDLHSDIQSELSDAVTLEQRRAYKIELQKGISLFNRKPSKGIELLIKTGKVGNSPEEIAAFLKKTAGLSETIIGDYLGERDEFCLKVMHAYVDSFNFQGMDFGEAIRFFLRGFRLPGEAQKIDRIMEKFAERYCKCNPASFTSADTAYVLAYSVILLNTDAHSVMVKDKMSKADFIRNNRGIDDGKDLSEEYLGTIYDQIVKNEIKMSGDPSVPHSKQVNSLNRLLGLDGILNLVSWKQSEEKPLGANGLLIKHIQEQFKAKSAKSESVYHVTDVAILRFMIEVCWGPMLAAFSMTLDQSDDKHATGECLLGFRYAVHVASVMGMQTQRDAFVTSIAKFTFLHCAADMKQKNVDAVKAIISIAIEDGNYLQDAWEHILTCLSRIEHLQLLGEGAPLDASFLAASNVEADDKVMKVSPYPSLKKKGSLQNPAVMAVVRGGSYDSSTVGVNSPGLVTSEQINNFISNLNLLEQIGNFELNHVFANSQRLNSEAIVAFVKGLCKVSISELQSPTDPRVFSLTKLVEIAHYNMNRIRLVWSRIWGVLSDFFVAVGLSENLSVAIFVMDSLRQLAMKFLEREELANYNFQNEFLRPFVIVMQKSSSTEIKELIVRCISQMVLSRVKNVKSGWKSVFMVFTSAAADERKNVVLLAFETMEKIVREYFPHITETETTTFTDCVRCLITFTNSRFNSDISLNAIAFLRFCALKLAEGGLVWDHDSKADSLATREDHIHELQISSCKDDHASFWIPLLTGLSNLTTDPRSAIRKSSLEVLFNIIQDHGHLFSKSFWPGVFNSVILPIFNTLNKDNDIQMSYNYGLASPQPNWATWDAETLAVAAQCLVDLFVSFFDIVKPQLSHVVSLFIGFIKSPVQGPPSTGVAALLRLTSEVGYKFSNEEWKSIFHDLDEAASSSVPSLLKVLRTLDDIVIHNNLPYLDDVDAFSEGFTDDDMDNDSLQVASYAISRLKSHIATQLLIIQVMADVYKAQQHTLSSSSISIILGTFSNIAAHASNLNSEVVLQKKLQRACSLLEISDPPLVHFENESYQRYLNFLQDLRMDNPQVTNDLHLELQLVMTCEKIMKIYLDCGQPNGISNQSPLLWVLPLGSAKKEELAARTSLLMSALRVLNGLEKELFRTSVGQLFPLLVDLVRSEHSSSEVPCILGRIFQACIGPLVDG